MFIVNKTNKENKIMKNLVNVLNVIVLVLMFIGMGVWYYKCFRCWIKIPMDRKIVKMKYNFRSKTRHFSVLEDGRSWIWINQIRDDFLFVKKEIANETTHLKVVFKDLLSKNISFRIDYELDSMEGIVEDPKARNAYFGNISLLHKLPVQIYEVDICAERIQFKINCEIREYCASISSEEFTIDIIKEIVSHHQINGITMKVAE